MNVASSVCDHRWWLSRARPSQSSSLSRGRTTTPSATGRGSTRAPAVRTVPTSTSMPASTNGCSAVGEVLGRRRSPMTTCSACGELGVEGADHLALAAGDGQLLEEQEVAPEVGRVGRRADHEVGAAVLDLAAGHLQQAQVGAEAEGADVHSVLVRRRVGRRVW